MMYMHAFVSCWAVLHCACNGWFVTTALYVNCMAWHVCNLSVYCVVTWILTQWKRFTLATTNVLRVMVTARPPVQPLTWKYYQVFIHVLLYVKHSPHYIGNCIACYLKWKWMYLVGFDRLVCTTMTKVRLDEHSNKSKWNILIIDRLDVCFVYLLVVARKSVEFQWH